MEQVQGVATRDMQKQDFRAAAYVAIGAVAVFLVFAVQERRRETETLARVSSEQNTYVRFLGSMAEQAGTLIGPPILASDPKDGCARLSQAGVEVLARSGASSAAISAWLSSAPEITVCAGTPSVATVSGPTASHAGGQPGSASPQKPYPITPPASVQD